MGGQSILLQNTSNNVKEECVSIRWANFYFRVFAEHHFGWGVSLGRPYTMRICSIFPLSMESNALEKSINNSVASRLFARSPSKIRWIVRICDVVDRFFQKLFWFFLRIYLISGSIRLSSRAFYILAAMNYGLRLGNSWQLWGDFSWGKGRMQPFVHLSIVFWLYMTLQYGNLLSFLLRCGTRPYERGTQWDSNSLV